MGARRASTSAVVAVVAGVLLVTLLVAWAASIGPSGVLRGEGPAIQRDTPTPTPTLTPTEGAKGVNALDDLRSREPEHSDLFFALAVVLELLLAGAALFGLYKASRWAVRTWRDRDRPDPPPAQVDFDVLEASEVLARELAEGAVAQRELLAGGTPRNAIVEVWNRFETLAGNVGGIRRPWETSSEFTLRVLEAVRADSTAVARLAALYREARFSDHELTEEDRAAAVAALAAIHAGFGSDVRERRP